MKLVEFGFPELSTGAKKTSRSGDLENRVCFAQQSYKIQEKIDVSVLRGSAGVENSACGVGFLTSCNT